MVKFDPILLFSGIPNHLRMSTGWESENEELSLETLNAYRLYEHINIRREAVGLEPHSFALEPARLHYSEHYLRTEGLTGCSYYLDGESGEVSRCGKEVVCEGRIYTGLYYCEEHAKCLDIYPANFRNILQITTDSYRVCGALTYNAHGICTECAEYTYKYQGESVPGLATAKHCIGYTSLSGKECWLYKMSYTDTVELAIVHKNELGVRMHICGVMYEGGIVSLKRAAEIRANIARRNQQ